MYKNLVSQIYESHLDDRYGRWEHSGSSTKNKEEKVQILPITVIFKNTIFSHTKVAFLDEHTHKCIIQFLENH